ncbi:unnamed protein product, partial [Chrysoparadoxa australica]
AFGSYYETLPKGIRMAVFRQVQTTDINSAYDRQKMEQDYFFRVNLDATSIEDANATLKSLFQQVKGISQQAYEQLTFGEYQAQGKANVKVNGYGAAFGLTNRTTLYGVFPYYDARVDLDIKRTKQNNYLQVAKSLEAQGDSTGAQILSQVAPSLPDINEGVVQSLIVNYLGYQPLGSWRGEGLADIELGFLTRLTDWTYSGLALSAGVVLPTGREDDPDNLVDFGFGDGQTDVFLEFGGGFTIPDTRWSFDSWGRFTYQFEHNREMRIPESRDYPYGSESAIFQEKLGNMYDLSARSTYQAFRWLGISGQYSYQYVGEAEYNSPYTEANEIKAIDTERSSHSVRGTLHFSTVPLYKSGDFFLPFDTNLSVQTITGGMNQPRFSRYDVEFRFYF